MHLYDVTVQWATVELYLAEVKLQSPDVPLSHLDLLPKSEQRQTEFLSNCAELRTNTIGKIICRSNRCDGDHFDAADGMFLKMNSRSHKSVSSNNTK